MTKGDSPGLAALITWKVLNLPRRSRKSEPGPEPEPRPRPSVMPRTLAVRHLETELEIRQQPRRTRTLSLSSICHDVDVGEPQRTEEQTESPLFALPKELRLMIYEHVLGDMVFHIVRRKAKLGHTLCKSRGDPEQCTLDRCRGFKIPSGIHTGHGNGQLVQLLQTCRKVYSEAIDVLYSKNIFNFDSLESFVSFSCAILPQRLDSIRKLQLDFRFNLSILYFECTPHTNWPRWERTWRIIASMLSLSEIQMRFSWPELSKCGKYSFLRVFEPMQLVTGLKTFEVTTPVLRNIWLKDFDDMPFRIVSEWTRGVTESEL